MAKACSSWDGLVSDVSVSCPGIRCPQCPPGGSASVLAQWPPLLPGICAPVSARHSAKSRRHTTHGRPCCEGPPPGGPIPSRSVSRAPCAVVGTERTGLGPGLSLIPVTASHDRTGRSA